MKTQTYVRKFYSDIADKKLQKRFLDEIKKWDCSEDTLNSFYDECVLQDIYNNLNHKEV